MPERNPYRDRGRFSGCRRFGSVRQELKGFGLDARLLDSGLVEMHVFDEPRIFSEICN